MTKLDRYKPLFEKESFYEMSNLTPDSTGLKYTVWITINSGRERHWARVKIYKDNGVISISISDEPEIKKTRGNPKIKQNDLVNIKKWIIQNKDTLLKHWKGEIDSIGLGKKIKKLKE